MEFVGTFNYWRELIQNSRNFKPQIRTYYDRNRTKNFCDFYEMKTKQPFWVKNYIHKKIGDFE